MSFMSLARFPKLWIPSLQKLQSVLPPPRAKHSLFSYEYLFSEHPAFTSLRGVRQVQMYDEIRRLYNQTCR